nr:hypothetical protein CFP56_42377 [Quercus suber]
MNITPQRMETELIKYIKGDLIQFSCLISGHVYFFLQYIQYLELAWARKAKTQLEHVEDATLYHDAASI